MKRNCLTDGPFVDAPESTFETDAKILKQIRHNVSEFLQQIVGHCTLEIGPKGEFQATHTLDIDPNSGATFIADITQPLNIPHMYDSIVCCEVLEHVTNPFRAVQNLSKLLTPGGKLYITVPYQFRIHGPLPDCWRISEFGLKAIAAEANLTVSSLECLIDPARPYFPLHYTCVLEKSLDHVTLKTV